LLAKTLNSDEWTLKADEFDMKTELNSLSRNSSFSDLTLCNLVQPLLPENLKNELKLFTETEVNQCLLFKERFSIISEIASGLITVERFMKFKIY
jgi:hypothetical protein